MLSPALVVGTALAYLAALFALAAWADRRGAAGRSVIANPWVYALSLGAYCTAWTYFGSVGRAASGGLWFLPIYLGPTLAMVLGWVVVRKMLRVARAQRITSIADFIASRHGKSPLLAGAVTLITVVGIVPYIALQLKAVATGVALLTTPPGAAAAPPPAWWQDPTAAVAALLAGFTMVFGTRHLDGAERHEGLVAAVAAESVVKLLAFTAVGVFACWGLFDGPADVFARAAADPALRGLLRLAPEGARFAHESWSGLLLLAGLSVLCLPRQFQLMVVENVDERHLKRAVWAFPAYLLAINLFVLPLALAGLLLGGGAAQADGFVLSLPLAHGQPGLALAAFVGGLSAATGMVVVETIAVSTMVCNDLVVPALLRLRRFAAAPAGWLRGIRRAAIAAVLGLGYAYFRLAGEAHALVSIGLISFAAVAQFAPALLGGLYWKGGTRAGALAGLGAGFALWAWTLLLPSLARSGWWPGADLLQHGPAGLALLRPEQLLGLQGLDGLTHALVWSLGANLALYVGVSLVRRPDAAEVAQALRFVDGAGHPAGGADAAPVFWRGRARPADLQALLARFLGPARAQAALDQHARERGLPGAAALPGDARLVQFAETQLAGAIGSASARVVVARSVEEEALGLDDVLRIVDEASQLRQYAQALEHAGAELRAANERLQELDRLKDDFMSSVTHELRTPLTSIRALSELMRDDPGLAPAQRQQFLAIIVAEAERLGRLVDQVLDMAKIEAGQADWRSAAVDLPALLQRAAQTTAELLHGRGATLVLELPDTAAGPVPPVLADEDRLLQVLLNLLSNAAKFVPAGRGRVVLALACGPEGATVTVQDNGPGVPPAQQALVFEKFRQGGDAAHRPAGTGLGLPISRQIVEHFGGRLWLRSDPGQGATFGFTLPWPTAPAAAPAAQDQTGDPP